MAKDTFTVHLTRKRPYRARDSDKEAKWVGPGEVEVPVWVAREWGFDVPEPAPPMEEPWEGYASMRASTVLTILRAVSDETKRKVLVYEKANKARKMVLQALLRMEINGGSHTDSAGSDSTDG